MKNNWRDMWPLLIYIVLLVASAAFIHFTFIGRQVNLHDDGWENYRGACLCQEECKCYVGSWCLQKGMCQQKP